jgi:CAAX protease family protein
VSRPQANRLLGALWRFAASVGIWYCAEFLASTIASPLYRHHWREFELVFRCAFLALLLGGFSLLIIVADSHVSRPLAYMGLDRTLPWVRESLLGAGIGIAIVALAVAAIAVVGSLKFSFTLTPRAFGRFGLELVVLLAGAMAEEVSFRGYPFQRLVDATGALPAVVVVSALFGAVHWANPSSSMWSIMNTALVGVLLCLAYLRTRALWLPWGLHFGWNFALGVIFGLPVSGLSEFAVIVHGKAQGPAWLTGGAYGIEASVTGTGVILIGVALLLLVVPRRPAPVEAPPLADIQTEPPISPTDSPSDLASNH